MREYKLINKDDLKNFDPDEWLLCSAINDKEVLLQKRAKVVDKWKWSTI